jgi:release factor glutamine methyltransferase
MREERRSIRLLGDRLATEYGLSAVEVRRVLSHVLSVSPEHVLAHGEDGVDQTDWRRAGNVAARLAGGEPFAYVRGSAGFHGREFIVDRRVLIPRPETEHMVEDAMTFLRARERPRALDVGTGSGAIACTLAAEMPDLRMDAVDVSPAAIAVARANRDRLGVARRVALFLGDLLEPVVGERYDAILANLPYVPDGAGDAALRFEPALALFAGPDGLDAYRRFFAAVPPLVLRGGIVLAEGAPPIAAGLLALARAAFPLAKVTLVCDYGGRERYVKVETLG